VEEDEDEERVKEEEEEEEEGEDVDGNKRDKEDEEENEEDALNMAATDHPMKCLAAHEEGGIWRTGLGRGLGSGTGEFNAP
jgi:hypothetical protein